MKGVRMTLDDRAVCRRLHDFSLAALQPRSLRHFRPRAPVPATGTPALPATFLLVPPLRAQIRGMGGVGGGPGVTANVGPGSEPLPGVRRIAYGLRAARGG